jgi:hypothetical protein
MLPRNRLDHGTIVRHGCERQKLGPHEVVRIQKEAATFGIFHFRLSIAEGQVMSSSLSSNKITVNV